MNVANGPAARIPTAVAAPPQSVPMAALKPSDSPRAQRQDESHVRKLAACEQDFEPILVHRPTMRVIDGMHRLAAARLRGHREIAVRFFDGGEADAYVLSVQLNLCHGLPLTRAERRLAAARILVSHPHWSDRAIAERTGLSDKTVGKLRRCASAEIPHSHTRVGRDGSVRPLNSAEGRRLVAALLAADPGASLRELARKSGLSTGTVRDVRDRLSRGQDPVPERQHEVVKLAATLPRALRRQRPNGRRQHDDPLCTPGGAALRKLANDPSLKATEPGRLLLRALFTTDFTPGQWEQIVAALPERWTPHIRVLAARRAEEWNALADALARSSRGAA
ncbi:helix-turn-helix domain-containing protein [Streptomyces sp. NPDC012510]|uniref:ParB/RepB/Spo0J family partition protein n=1 Tax=Streptomyces sp. NPDC012510 TaxID=3364838 RepID=UPI0036E2DCAA